MMNVSKREEQEVEVSILQLSASTTTRKMVLDDLRQTFLLHYYTVETRGIWNHIYRSIRCLWTVQSDLCLKAMAAWHPQPQRLCPRAPSGLWSSRYLCSSVTWWPSPASPSPGQHLWALHRHEIGLPVSLQSSFDWNGREAPYLYFFFSN
jgi:hypothetical protein